MHGMLARVPRIFYAFKTKQSDDNLCKKNNRAKLEGRRKDGAEAIKEEKNDKQY